MTDDFNQGDQMSPQRPLDDGDERALGGVMVAPDGTQVPLTAEQAQAVKEAADAADQQRKDMIEELVLLLINKRDNCIKARRDIERRWIDDQRQWDGADRLMNTKEFPSQTNNDNMMPPRPHLTRSRCDLWESRMIDLLAPTNDPTWELAPMTVEDIAPPPDLNIGIDAWQQALGDIKAEMEVRAQKMRDVIKDQMGACNATRALRKMCIDACRLGTGLVMGPMNGTHIRRRYSGNPEDPVQVQIEESIVPELREGDPWCFYPDMTNTAGRAGYAFYLHPMDELQLWEFSEYPGVDKEEVEKLMDEKPDYGEVEVTLRERNQHSGLKESIDDRHAVWRYTGIVDRKYCEVLGIDDVDGPISADIWFCNHHILKSKLTMLSTAKDFRIPYYVFSPFPIDDTMFGASIAYLCRDSQRTATASWLMMLHNISVSSGPQILIREGKVTPKDGKYSVRGPKVWGVTDDNVKLEDVFFSYNIENNAAQAQQAFNMAKDMLDEELNTVQWASPDPSDVTQTASGLAMLMNARTILQRRVCACADDDVFGPMIERFVLWNTLYNPRDDIKGDYDVRPLCQSVRLVKDIRIQQKLFALQTFVFAPNTQTMFEPYDAVADVLRDMDIQVENWMIKKDAWTKLTSQAPPPDPKAQLAMANAQLIHEKTVTEQAKQQQIQAGNLGTPSQSQEDQNAEQSVQMQKHQMDKAVELQTTNSKLAMAQASAESRQYAADAQLQARREGIAADLLKAHVRNTHDLIKSGMHPNISIQSPRTKFVQGPGMPNRPAGKFTPPAVPKFHRGKT